MANNVEYAARMTNHQFSALATLLDSRNLFLELTTLSCAKSAGYNFATMSKWLRNSWNTECVLKLNLDAFSEEELGVCVHWAFPQAYYSVFSAVLAYFNVAGKSQQSHAAVIKEFGNLVATSKHYPKSMSFYADGAKQHMVFHGVSPGSGESIRYIKGDRASAEKQVSQFLRATRQLSLDDKKADMKFGSAGIRKARLTEAEWQKVSQKLGKTTLLSLLYRKRIKANYDDIEVLTSMHLNCRELLSDLCVVVRNINAVHEWLIRTAVDEKSFDEALGTNSRYHFVRDSYHEICTMRL